jgi:uncharacterized membrane protein YdjX (TVP38/TMEM64 family)
VRFRKFLTWAWVAVVIAIFLAWLRDPGIFTPARLTAALGDHQAWIFPAWFVFAILRGALLVPSTWAVVGGAALFPESLLTVFIVSMTGIVLSAALLYRFPGYAGYDAVLARKYPAQLERLQRELVRPRAIWLVAGWAIFPLVPTDLICYAAGLVHMPFRRMMLGIIIGEVPLVALYLLLGSKLAGFLPF